MARPRKQIDPTQVEALAKIHCTVAEIAAVLGCSKRTLETRFCAVIEKGREEGRASVRRQQFKLLQAGNATMAVWLGKQLLGQRDKVENTGADGGAQRIIVEHVDTNPNPETAR